MEFSESFIRRLHQIFSEILIAVVDRNLECFFPSSMVNDKWKLVKDIPFSNTMKAPRFIFENDNFDQLLRGVLVQHAQKLDNIFTIQVSIGK